MEGILTYKDYENDGLKLLKFCIKNSVAISGEVVEDFIDNHPEFIADEGYEDFEDSNRWTIGKYYIVNIDGAHYRCWEEVGLTEMEPNYWNDQTFEKVELRERVISEWEISE